jgi:hypothetical protein
MHLGQIKAESLIKDYTEKIINIRLSIKRKIKTTKSLIKYFGLNYISKLV